MIERIIDFFLDNKVVTFTSSVSFIDPMTRVARVRAEMPNPAGLLKPEMIVTGTLKSTLSGRHDQLVVPKTAILWTGTRSVVWVKDARSQEPEFHYREVTLGAAAGDSYVVLAGLSEGERVVSNGAFSIDAAAQLQGKTSMMHHSNTGAGNDHTAGNDAPSPGASDARNISVAPAFLHQLRGVFVAYAALTAALVASDASKAVSSAAGVKHALSDVDAAALKEPMRTHWAEKISLMRKSLNDLAGTRDIAGQRKAYGVFGNTLYAAILCFGIDGGSVYRQYCPMAFDNKGAYWLSAHKEIRNPYFGEAMLTCGSTKNTINQ